MIHDLITTIRPRQWLKNGFILAPLFFAGNLYNYEKYPPLFLTFAAFCLAASGIYVMNDIIDREADRWHPLKCHRPVAAGTLSVPHARRLAVFLFGSSLLLTITVNWATTLTVVVYILLFACYCLVFKHIVLVDVVIIACGFVLRCLAGSYCIEVRLSFSLAACTFFLALFLVVCKRYHEYKTLGDDAELHRAVHDRYSLRLLKIMGALTALGTIASYGCYTVGAMASTSPAQIWLYVTNVFVLAGLARYVQLAMSPHTVGTPTEMLLTDKILLGIVLLWTASLFLIFTFA